MELKKIALATAVASLAGLYGCTNEGDVANIDIDSIVENNNGGGVVTNPGVTLGESTCPEWALPQTQIEVDDAAQDVCGLPARIDEDRTLSADKVWKLLGRVTVGNGNNKYDFTNDTVEIDGDPVALENVELKIEAGTEILATKGTFANLIITRGSTIMAEGTADAPIVFSSDDDGYEGSGEWGGLILHGFGQHNKCWTAGAQNAECNIDAEGESGFAGGFDNTDSSGSLKYVVVAEGGFEFAVGNEINGISFVAVGAGTTVENIQVHNNADDGVEFYGGAVSAKYLVLTGNQDDSVDWDEGYQGNLQYLLVKQSDEKSGNLVEADTLGNDEFDSIPVIANATFIASAYRKLDDSDPLNDEFAKTDLHVLKAESGAYFFNTVMDAVVVENRDGSAKSITCVNIDDASTDVVVYENIVHDCDAFYSTADLTAGATVNSADPALDANYASAAGVAKGMTAPAFITDNEDADVNNLYDTKSVQVGFFDAAGLTFAGAVNPDAASAWFEGWIVDGSL